MTFKEWWKHFNSCCPLDITDENIAEHAYEAGIQEGIDRMYRLYDICPECKASEGQHRLHCNRGHEYEL